MTNPIPWIVFVARAIDFAIDTAKAAGIDPPGAGEIEQLRADINASAAKLLPASVVALNVAVQLAAADVSRRVDSLPDDPRCPNILAPGSVSPGVVCGAVLKQSVLKPVNGDAPTRSYSCPACGWKS